MPLFPLSTGGGGSVPPTTDLLDDITNVPGSILARAGTAWVGVAAGTATYVLTSQGPGQLPVWMAAGTSGGGGGGSGDVVGPVSADDGNMVMFAGSSGKQIADSGVAASRVVYGPVISGTYLNFTYASNGDTNGIVYYLGTLGLTAPFVNPDTLGQMRAMRSSDGNGSRTDLTSRLGGLNTHTLSVVNSWIGVDIGSNRFLTPNKYTLRNRGQFGTTNWAGDWVFQGSNNVGGITVADWNAATWVDIQTVTGNTDLSNNDAYTAQNVGVSAPYRFFRWMMTGSDNLGSYYFTVENLELYGAFQDNPSGTTADGVPRWVGAGGGEVKDSQVTIGDDGDLSANALIMKSAAIKTATYTMIENDFLILGNTTSGSFLVYLPASPANGRMVVVGKISASNTLTVVRNGNNIDGAAANINLTADNATLQLQFVTGFGWKIL